MSKSHADKKGVPIYKSSTGLTYLYHKPNHSTNTNGLNQNTDSVVEEYKFVKPGYILAATIYRDSHKENFDEPENSRVKDYDYVKPGYILVGKEFVTLYHEHAGKILSSMKLTEEEKEITDSSFHNVFLRTMHAGNKSVPVKELANEYVELIKSTNSKRKSIDAFFIPWAIALYGAYDEFKIFENIVKNEGVWTKYCQSIKNKFFIENNVDGNFEQ